MREFYESLFINRQFEFFFVSVERRDVRCDAIQLSYEYHKIDLLDNSIDEIKYHHSELKKVVCACLGVYQRNEH